MEADLLIHVVDLSHPRLDEHMAAVDAVIKEIGAYGKQTLVVFNKIDALCDRDLAQVYLEKFPGSVAISARTGEGVADLDPGAAGCPQFVAAPLPLQGAAERIGAARGGASRRPRPRVAL